MEWIESHIEEHDPGSTVMTTTHSCPECAYYIDTVQPRKNLTSAMTTEEVKGKGYSRIISNFGRPADENLLDLTSMCGLWVDPSFMEECDFWPEGVPEEAIRIGIAYASEVLNRMIGSQITGLCERTVHPGNVFADRYKNASREINCPPGRFYTDKAPERNLYCDTFFEDCEYDEIKLPGPIQGVGEVVINGEILDKERYRILNLHTLIRVDGEPWPRENNCLARSPYKVWPPVILDGNPGAPSLESDDWHARWSADVNLSAPPVTQDLSSIENICDAPNWGIEFLARNPLAFEAKDDHWIDLFFERHGISPTKVAGDAIVEDRWILTPQDGKALADKLSEGCPKCDGCKTFGTCCEECGAVNAVVYRPKLEVGESIPDWLNIWANKRGILPSEEPFDLLTKVANDCDICIIDDLDSDEINNKLKVCQYDCGQEPTPIDLSGLNYGIYPEEQVVGLTLETCCARQAETLLDVASSVFQDFDDTRFRLVVETMDRYLKDPDPVCLDDVDLACLEQAPGWVRKAFDPDYLEPDLTRDFEVALSEDHPSWVNKYLGEEQSTEIKDFFGEWIENNPSLDVNFTKEVVVEPQISVHQWNNPNIYNSKDELGVADDSVSWAIRYYFGKPPSRAAQIACAYLARELAISLCDANACFNSRNMNRLTIGQSADYRWPDLFKTLEKGYTGIAEIDWFVKSVNPAGLQRTGYAMSASKYLRSRKMDQVRRA